MNGNGKSIDDIVDSYLKKSENFKNELIMGIKEGVDEGIKEGIEKGILDGLAECFHIGFLNMARTDVKEINEIFKDVFSETTEEEIKSFVGKEICPKIDENIQNVCDIAVDEIKEQKITISSGAVELIKEQNLPKFADTKIDEIKQDMERHLPKNFVLSVLLQKFQTSISECFVKSLNRCKNKTRDAVLE